MTTSWTDEEYGRVAAALLWPRSRLSTVVLAPLSPAVQIAFLLGPRLEGLDLQAKTDALTLADSILQAEAQRDVAAAKSPHVTQVGDIRLDARLGQSVRAQSIEERRDRLASRVDFYVNPSAVRLGAAGGINATWSP